MIYWKSPAWLVWLGLSLAGAIIPGAVLAQKSRTTPGTSVAYQQLVRQLRMGPSAGQTICYASNRTSNTRILPPDAFLKARNNPRGRSAATSQFIVTYTNFTPQAQAAFQYAVDIWSTLITSSVPIRIQANWTDQAPNVLGSARATDYRIGGGGVNDPGGRQKAFGWYPIALAEKIARRDMNGTDQPDIVANFNRNTNWYYGLDAKTPAGQTDLVSVVLHEICHGLGFFGQLYTEGTNGGYALGYPGVYDHFIENTQGQRLVGNSAYPENSNALYRQLTGNNLYLNGPVMRQRTGQRARIYAPATFDRGSSISHLDETTYPPGNPNSLMTYAVDTGEAIHNPGPLVLSLFTDMEWKTTSVLHEPLISTEDVKDLAFSARVVSDTTLTAGSVRFFYRKGAPTATDSAFTAVTPTRVGTTDQYAYTLPAAQAQGDLWYYFQVQDASGRTFTNPGKNLTGGQVYHRVQIGPDNVPPTVRYSPAKNFIFATGTTVAADSIPIVVEASDDRQTGIDTVYVEYQVNGVFRAGLSLRYSRRAIEGRVYDSLYVNRIDFPANSLKVGDKISYRIVARDSSRARNQTFLPATGFFELTVVQTQATRDQYVNTFSSTSTASDFVGYGFGLATPTGFSDAAIHSEHPYRNGTDYRYQSNYEYVLLAPIRVKSNPDSAVIRFDEIVLVEPGEPGARYTDENFYDYVVVEGSSDNGRTWKPLLDGYDSNSQSDWLAAYNRNLVAGLPNEQNSATVGTPALYKLREIPLLGTGTFRAGDQILVRFRLFADQLAHGWGWAVDNLRIQVPLPPPVLGNEPISLGRFSVYPNPVSSGLVQLDAELVRPASEAGLTVTSPTGQIMRQLSLKMSGTKLRQSLDLSHLPTGLYFIKLNAGDAVLTQKLLIAH